MQKADNVNSRNRRAFLSTMAGAIPALTATTTSGSPAKPVAAPEIDPVFAAIEAHRAAADTLSAALTELNAAEESVPQDWIFWEASDCFVRQEGLGWHLRIEEGAELAERIGHLRTVLAASREAEAEALNDLSEATPATIGSMIALTDYLAESEWDSPVRALAQSIGCALRGLAVA
jgi:hypothetical protein